MFLRRALVAAAALALVLTGCTPAEEGPLTLTSPDLDASGHLPDWATATVGGNCRGANTSPTLRWWGVPAGTKSFAVQMTHPQRPEFDHWIVTGLPGDLRELPSAPLGEIGVGVTGQNFQGPGRYVGVCIPGEEYEYTVFALDAEIVGDETTTVADLAELIDGHVLESAALRVLRAEG